MNEEISLTSNNNIFMIGFCIIGKFNKSQSKPRSHTKRCKYGHNDSKLKKGISASHISYIFFATCASKKQGGSLLQGIGFIRNRKIIYRFTDRNVTEKGIGIFHKICLGRRSEK